MNLANKALGHARAANEAIVRSENCRVKPESRDALIGLLELAHHESLRCAEALATELVNLAVREDKEP